MSHDQEATRGDPHGTLSTVGVVRSALERELDDGRVDPFGNMGEPHEGGVIAGELLGAGGMGVVRAGLQTALRRQVAVKRTLGSGLPQRDAPFLAFLREAWISAQLEHPNIVPVHVLCSDRGHPQLVMKRVEGLSWRALLDDDALAAELGMRDRLAFHLDILGRVCRAVHFAHSRKIVHLDLKPDNVMVGRHGEVYLLDWGVAASFDDGADPWIPRASDIGTVVGTPAYLSPEQAAGLGAVLGPRTDVFLLGALAHRIVTGRPPNRGESVDDVIAAAFSSDPPPYGDEVPAELAGILRKAMARSQDERFGSAEELRLALAAFLQHRESNAILEAALARLQQLRDHGQGGRASLEPAVARRVESECRFGLEEALSSWPGNTRARAALDDLARVIVERALRAGDWRRAAAALDRLPAGDDALWQQVRAARAEALAEESERRALEDLGSNQDILRHAHVRSVIAGAVSVSWFVWFVWLSWALREGLVQLTHPALMVEVAVTITLYGGVMWAVRDTLMATQIDRRALLLLAASFGGVGVLWALCWQMGIAPLHALMLSSGVYVFFFVAMTMVMERRLAWVTLALLPVAFGSFLDPDHVLAWQGGYVLVGGTALALIWRRDGKLAAARELANQSKAAR